MRRPSFLSLWFGPVIAISFGVVTGCGGDDSAPAWVGSYDAQGTWNLSGPLGVERTFGDAVADVLIENIVGLTGVPSVFEDEAIEIVGTLIRDDVKVVVDENLPAELAPQGTVTEALATALADVRVDSVITLEEGFLGRVKGTEVVTGLSYPESSRRISVDPTTLAGARLEAEWEGDTDDGNTLSIDPHGFALHYGTLVQNVAQEVVDAAALTELEDAVAESVACSTLVSAILGTNPNLEINLAEWSYGVSSEELNDACTATRGLVENRVLGVFSTDSGIVVGGGVRWSDTDEDGVAETLENTPSFGGYLDVASEAVAPKLTVDFQANRR